MLCSDVRRNPRRFILFVVKMLYSDDIDSPRRRLNRMNGLLAGCSVQIVTDKLVGASDHFGRAAIVCRQLNNGHFEIVLQCFQALWAGSVPLIDNLVVVRDDKEVFRILPDEGGQNAVLGQIGVLEFIDTNMWVNRLDLRYNGWVLG